jgi:hypothetical protein
MTATTTYRHTTSTVHVFRVGDRVRIRHMSTTPDQDAGHLGVVVHITARRIRPVTVRVGHHRDQYDPTELDLVVPDTFPARPRPTRPRGKATTAPTYESGDGAGR